MSTQSPKFSLPLESLETPNQTAFYKTVADIQRRLKEISQISVEEACQVRINASFSIEALEKNGEISAQQAWELFTLVEESF